MCTHAVENVPSKLQCGTCHCKDHPGMVVCVSTRQTAQYSKLCNIRSEHLGERETAFLFHTKRFCIQDFGDGRETLLN